MDYSQLSDFEINNRVSNIIPGRFIIYSDYVWDSEEEKKFDPCNNPADAWPIIQDNYISIGYDGISWDAFSIKWDVRYNDWKTHPENPLRIAMILFLMGRDIENANQ